MWIDLAKAKRRLEEKNVTLVSSIHVSLHFCCDRFALQGFAEAVQQQKLRTESCVGNQLSGLCQLFEPATSLMSLAFSWTHVDSLDFFATVFQVVVVVLQFNLSTVFTVLFCACLERFCSSLNVFGILLNSGMMMIQRQGVKGRWHCHMKHPCSLESQLAVV